MLIVSRLVGIAVSINVLFVSVTLERKEGQVEDPTLSSPRLYTTTKTKVTTRPSAMRMPEAKNQSKLVVRNPTFGFSTTGGSAAVFDFGLQA